MSDWVAMISGPEICKLSRVGWSICCFESCPSLHFIKIIFISRVKAIISDAYQRIHKNINLAEF